MPARWTVLASGSSGNASLLQVDGFGLLIDAGLGPRRMASRLACVGASWRDVHAVLLTHTHSDHWKDTTLEHLRRAKIPFYCHPQHQEMLQRYGVGFRFLQLTGLVRWYEAMVPLHLSPTLTCWPIEVAHDAEPTFAFRFEGSPHLFGAGWAMGFASDLGSWTSDFADLMANVNLLAVEFNHDESMERASSRPIELIERVLGDRGHLSNEQAADLVRAVLQRSRPNLLRHLVLLHLSRECNTPQLAFQAAQRALAATPSPTRIHVAEQETVLPTIDLESWSRIRGVPSAPRK